MRNEHDRHDSQRPGAGIAQLASDERSAREPCSEIVEHEALGYSAWGTPEGEFLARQMDRLAQLIRWTGASTPEDHEDRMEVWDAEIRDRYWDMGFHEGLVAGRRECRCGTCFKDRD